LTTADFRPTTVVIALAIIGFSLGILRLREIWNKRLDTSRHARYLRIRYGVLALSPLGLLFLFFTQLLGLPIAVADAGAGLIFLSWGGFLILSIVFGFLEGFAVSNAGHLPGPPNTRLKLSAPVLEGRIAFVHRTVWRRSLGAIR